MRLLDSRTIDSKGRIGLPVEALKHLKVKRTDKIVILAYTKEDGEKGKKLPSNAIYILPIEQLKLG